MIPSAGLMEEGRLARIPVGAPMLVPVNDVGALLQRQAA